MIKLKKPSTFLFSLIFMSAVVLAFQNCGKKSTDFGSQVFSDSNSSQNTTTTNPSGFTDSTTTTTTTTLPTDPQFVEYDEGVIVSATEARNTKIIPSGSYILVTVSAKHYPGDFRITDAQGTAYTLIHRNFASPPNPAFNGEGIHEFDIWGGKVNQDIQPGQLSVYITRYTVVPNNKWKMTIQVFKNVNRALFDVRFWGQGLSTSEAAVYDLIRRSSPYNDAILTSKGIAAFISVFSHTDIEVNGYLLSGNRIVDNVHIWSSLDPNATPLYNDHKQYMGTRFINPIVGEPIEYGAMLLPSSPFPAGFFRSSALIYLVP